MGHAYLSYVPAFPKPSQVKRELPHVKVFPDGREVCQTRLDKPEGAEGRAEYKRRKKAMWERQKGICCLYGFLPSCPGKLLLKEATFEHEDGRGAGGNCFIKDFAAFREYTEKINGNSLDLEFLKKAEEKNIELLVNSGKSLNLLEGVYGKEIIDKFKK